MSHPASLLAPLLRGLKRPSSQNINICSKLQFRPGAPCQRHIFSNSNRLDPRFTRFTDAERAKRRLNIRRVLYLIIFSSFGYFASLPASRIRRPVIEPGSVEDSEALKELSAKVEELDIVKKLRSSPDYVEWEAYSNFSPEEKERRLTSGSLKGTRGISMQRVFYNEAKKTATTVLYIGNGAEGWPRIVHGGILATILDENMGRVALRYFPARTGVTANLDINYRKLTKSGQFYVVTASCDLGSSTDRKAFVTGEIRDEKGNLCVEAKGLFVVPKSLELRKIGDEF
ncbi:hypothetical protein VTO42DRAFT_7376 [Malbranchea cinnamomea]